VRPVPLPLARAALFQEQTSGRSVLPLRLYDTGLGRPGPANVSLPPTCRIPSHPLMHWRLPQDPTSVSLISSFFVFPATERQSLSARVRSTAAARPQTATLFSSFPLSCASVPSSARVLTPPLRCKQRSEGAPASLTSHAVLLERARRFRPPCGESPLSIDPCHPPHCERQAVGLHALWF